MRRRSYYDHAAKKQTVSLTINSDLYAKARAEGLSVSQIAEEALAKAYTEQMRTKIAAELREEAAAYDAFVTKHGSLAELAREQFAQTEGQEALETDAADLDAEDAV